MEKKGSLLISLYHPSAGALACLASFGVILAVAWSLGSSTVYKLSAAVSSSILAVIVGGAVVARLAKQNRHAASALFGFFIGGLSSLYILGISIWALPISLLSSFLALLGALVQNPIKKQAWGR